MEHLLDRFVDAVARSDAPAIADTLTRDVRLRALVPSGFREAEGPEAVAAKYVGWFGGYDAELLSSMREEIGGRIRLSYRLRLRRDGARWNLEQVAFCDLHGEAIRRIDLVCSGFRPVVEHESDHTYSYDAGHLSCNEGLDEQFKRAIQSIPVGGVMHVRARDASAKVELPSFARLLGHHVHAVEEQNGDGVLVRVERRR